MKNTYFKRMLAVVAGLLFASNVLAASDYLLEIEGIKGECKGQKFTLTENADGSFSATNIPGGTYKVHYRAKAGKTGATKRTASESVSFECVVSPRDAASGLPTGKRQHKPFTITKEIDKSSPAMLGQIVVGDLDGDGDPDVVGAAKTNTSTSAPVKAGYDLKLNKKV